MTEQLKAEAYVREQRPALMELTFGCEVKDTHNQQYYKVCNKSVNGDLFVSHGSLISNQYRISEDRIVIIGHPINLHDWLAVLGLIYSIDGEGNVWQYPALTKRRLMDITFNLTTGQPATEADFKIFNEIVSV